MRCVHATLLLLICAYNVAAGPFRRSTTLPITHEPYIESRQDGTTDLKAALRSLDRTRNKYDAHRSLKRRGGATNGTRINNEKLSSQTKRAPGGARAIVPMVSSRLDHDFDVQRTPFVRLEVKGVPDYFTVIFDTASVGLALPGQYCIRDCNGKKYPNSGYPLGVTDQVLYSGGQIAEGDYFRNDVALGGITVKAQRLLSISRCRGFYQTPDTKDTIGVMGFGFNAPGDYNGFDSVFQNLVAQDALQDPEVSFYFARIRTEQAEGSALTLGGRDPSKYFGEVTTVPIKSGQPFWRIAVDQATVNGVPAGPNSNIDAIIDTGSTYIVAPLRTVRDIFKFVVGSFEVSRVAVEGIESRDVFFAYPCAVDSNIAFTIGGRSFKLSHADMKLAELTDEFIKYDVRGLGLWYDNYAMSTLDRARSSGQAYCLSTIVGSNSLVHDHYVLGLTFLRSYVSIFSLTNPPTVSFAESRDNLSPNTAPALGIPVPPVPNDWHGPAQTNAEADQAAEKEFKDDKDMNPPRPRTPGNELSAGDGGTRVIQTS